MSYYTNVITSIEEHFGVTDLCAKYIYHRALRSKRPIEAEGYLNWDIKLQNALVYADRCLGIEWEKVLFGEEEDYLHLLGINVEDMNNTSFKWKVEQEEWTIVNYKKRKHKNLFVNAGIYA